jgi:F0F1-type ATP synthase assembly protein I
MADRPGHGARAGGNEKDEDERARILRRAGPYMGLGVTMAASVVVGILGGRWLDNRLGTTPWLTVAGLLLGVGAGFYNLMVVLLRRPTE